MVELTFSKVLRRFAAASKKQHSTARGFSLSKSYIYMMQRSQLANSNSPLGQVLHGLNKGITVNSLVPDPDAESTGTREAISRCAPASKRLQQTCVEDLPRHVTHIINNGEDIDTIEKGLVCLLPNVEVLYLFDNRLSQVDVFRLWTRLRNVYLQNNLIQSVGLVFNNLPFLEELNLDGNHISRLEGLRGCPRLTRISVANQQTPHPLTFAAESLRALSKSLRFLCISNNRLDQLRPLASLQGLEFLEAANNNIETFETIAEVLAGCRQLKSLDLRQNPLKKAPKLRQYLRFILLHASDELCELDGKSVAHVQREFVRDLHGHQQEIQRQRLQDSGASQEVSLAVE